MSKIKISEIYLENNTIILKGEDGKEYGLAGNDGIATGEIVDVIEITESD